MPSSRRYRPFFCSLCSLLVFWGVTSLRAHVPSETYLTLFLTGTNLSGQWDVAHRDLLQALSLLPGIEAWSKTEREERQEALALDTITRLSLQADGTNLALKVTDYFPISLHSGEYVRFQFSALGLDKTPNQLALDARALFAIDPAMHGYLRLERDGRTESVTFNARSSQCNFELTGTPNRWAQWSTFVREGVWHIWIGFDHILFLIALLVPSVLRRDGACWEGVDRLRPASMNVLKIVTAFTVAHSVTLSLAALDIMRLPTRLVESTIAASVALAAGNNLWPWFGNKGWRVAFCFGLVHGFGFASVLTELGLAKANLASALVGFNVGVELGQLAIVLVFLPAAFLIRSSAFYRVAILRLGSAAVVVVALVWMVERLLG
jgi:hypothetical protein